MEGNGFFIFMFNMMRNICLIVFSMFQLLLSAATVDIPTGYYRIENAYTERYLHVINDYGYLDYMGMAADCSSIQPRKGLEEALYTPASIINVIKKSDGTYVFAAQGTNTTAIIGNIGISLRQYEDGYLCGGSYQGVTLFLADVLSDDYYLNDIIGNLNTVSKVDIPTTRKWYLYQVTADSDNSYFGLKPTVELNGKYYLTLYVDFAFKPYSNGMKVYTLDHVNDGVAAMLEFTGDVVPAKTPVIVECSSSEPANNKVEIQSSSSSSVSNNLLKGVFFRTGETYKDGNRYRNVTRFVSATDRVLGVTSDGKLGLVAPTEEYVPANTGFYRASDGTGLASELPLEVYDPAGISSVTVDNAQSTSAVYTLQGVKVADNFSASFLAPGIYIVGGKKMVVK